MNETNGENADNVEETLSIAEIADIVDKEFNETYHSIRLRYAAPDIFFLVPIAIIAYIVCEILNFTRNLVAEAPVAVGLTLLLSIVAIVLSFSQMVMKWYNTPLFNMDAYYKDIIEKNCKEISEDTGVPNDLLLYSLVSMKAQRPSVNLGEAMDFAPDLFSENNLVFRLYHSQRGYE